MTNIFRYAAKNLTNGFFDSKQAGDTNSKKQPIDPEMIEATERISL